ncbi:substrate-binding domain-containing protein [Anaeromyxobacter diazotrophicus]|uniref:PBP domain-containing protein n=1 Tax=Anaeromyxobacter diazotrophicus TaxID=2590199 RepID=A0A7I9VTH2_9BACT|nr:substrate-binding domain-containing protein [Anaeromyxobacter diazotrophicus]GEJ59548.1 hypothetical protein AMYX_42890 [Anaeromyxobacter diazotrophicus]
MRPSARTPRLPRRRLTLALGLALASAALGGPAPARAEPARFKVVIHEDCPVTELSREQLSRLFLGKAAEWPDGTRADPVDQREGSAAREAFTHAVHRRSVSAVKLQWQHAIFSGRGVPPREVSGDAAVLEHVRTHPGAVGYVSASADVQGARVLSVKE